MPTSKGKVRALAYVRSIPEQIENKVLRGAARAAIDVIADEAGLRATSDEVRENLVKKVRLKDGRVIATLTVKEGWARTLANWLEYGTEGHFITVDARDNGGRSVRRTNDLVKAGTLVIGGTPVGPQVWHPGARPHPFLRVSLDVRGAEAAATAQSYINAKVARGRISGGGA